MVVVIKQELPPSILVNTGGVQHQVVTVRELVRGTLFSSSSRPLLHAVVSNRFFLFQL